MLIRLLEIIEDAEGPVSTQALARQLGVPERLVPHMLDDLRQLGMVATDPSCASGPACGGCALRGSCSAETPTWRLTDRAT